MIVNNILATC